MDHIGPRDAGQSRFDQTYISALTDAVVAAIRAQGPVKSGEAAGVLLMIAAKHIVEEQEVGACTMGAHLKFLTAMIEEVRRRKRGEKSQVVVPFPGGGRR